MERDAACDARPESFTLRAPGRTRCVRVRAIREMSRPRWLWAGALLAALLGVQAAPPPPAARRLRLLGWDLELHENRAIRSPYYDECKFYRGKVLGEEQSTASVTECGGQLYGLIQVGEEDFVVQPRAVHEGRAHTLRRRDVALEEPVRYDLTGDTVTDLDLDFDDEPMAPHIRPRHSDYAPMIDYLRSEGPVTRSISGA